MTQAISTDDLSITIATRSDLSEMAALLANAFSTREPPAVAAGFPAEKIEALAHVFGGKSIHEGLGVIARAGDSGAMIGAVLAHDFATPPPDEITPLVPVFEPLLVFLDQLESAYSGSQDIGPESHVHVFMIAVDDAWGGRGIAQDMLSICLSNAAGKGYRTAFTEATSQISRHVFHTLGFEERAFARYLDFKFKNGHPFASIREHGGCALMDKNLG